MELKTRHIQVRTDPQTYKKLKLLCAEQGWTFQTLFTRMIQDYIENASEPDERRREP